MGEWNDLVKYRLERAKETLALAKDLLERGYYKDSNNRSYYAAYYAMKALYALQNRDFRKHKTLIATFNKEFVASGIFPREMGKKVSMLSIVREQSDYEDFYIVSKQQCKEQYMIAEELVDQIYEYIMGETGKMPEN